MQQEDYDYTQSARYQSIRKPKVRSSAAQMNAMIKYMTRGAQSTKEEFDPSLDIPELRDKEWDSLAEILNKIGPAIKTVSAWKVSWRDLKRATRMKQVEKDVSSEEAQSFISNAVIPEIAQSGPALKHGYYGMRKMRSSNAQINTMVDYMATNKRFARGEFVSPLERRKHDHEWVRLASLLNEMGPAVKNVAAWRVTWRDLTRNTRKKQFKTDATASVAEKIEEIMARTGDGYTEENDETGEDSNGRSSPIISAPPSPDGSNQDSASELDSPEDFEELESDSSPCPSPIEGNARGKPRCTAEQIKALVDCLAINPGLAFGRQDAPEKVDDWKHLRTILNRLGPPKRTLEWRRHWRNLRNKSVLNSKNESKCDMKMSAVCKKVLEIVDAHKERQRNEPEDESEDDIDLNMPPEVLSPDIHLTLIDLDPNEDVQSTTRGSQMSPVPHGSQVSPVPHGSQVSPVPHGSQVSPVPHGSQVSPGRRSDRSVNTSHDMSLDYSQDLDGNAQDSDGMNEVGSERKPKRRCTNTQLTALVKYMSDHPDLAAPAYSSPHANATREAKWRQLTKHLNTMGTAKTIEGWKRTWRGIKSTVRTKNRKLTKLSVYLYQKVQDILEPKKKTDENDDLRYPDNLLSDVSSSQEQLISPDIQQDSMKRNYEDSSSAVENYIKNEMPPENCIRVISPIRLSVEVSAEHISGSDTGVDLKRANDSGNDNIVRSTKPQINALVNYMSNHRTLAISKNIASNETDPGYAEWRQLARYLNKMGPAKSTSGWRNTWRHLKRDACRKDRKPSIMSEKILAILNGLPVDNDLDPESVEKFIACEPSSKDMSTLNLRSSSPLPGYCKTRPTNTQIYALVNYISKHTDLASCFTSVDTQDPHLTEWRLLARYLNRLGTAKKSTLAWKRTWRDLKSSVVNNRRTSTPWNDKINQKVIEIIDAAKINDDSNHSNNEKVESNQLPCSSEGMSVAIQPPPNEQPVIKSEPEADPVTPGQDPDCDQNQSRISDCKDTDIEQGCENLSNQKITAHEMSVVKSEPTPETHVFIKCEYDTSQMSPEQCSNEDSQEDSLLMETSHEDQTRSEEQAPAENENKQSDDRSQESTKPPKKTRCTNLQLRALTDYMCEHPDLALYNLNSKEGVKEWRRLTRNLNKMGAAKTTIAWKRTWRDIKKAVRRGKSGGGLDKVREKNVRELLGLESADGSQNAEKYAETQTEPLFTFPPENTTIAKVQRCIEILTKRIDDQDERRETATDNCEAASEMHSLLKEMIIHLKRSNELKAEQNGYLRQFLKQISPHTLPTENADGAIHTDTDVASVVIQKQEIGDQTDSTEHNESQFCAEDFCVAQLDPSVSNGVEGPDTEEVTLEKRNKTREEILKQKRLAERLRYERLRSDPQKRELMKEKERQKYLIKKEKGLIKPPRDIYRDDEDSLSE